MNKINQFDVMRKYNLADWPAVALGWEKRWITKSDVIQYAVQWLEQHAEESRLPVILLAGGEDYDDDTIGTYLHEICQKLEYDEAALLNKWRLAYLESIAESNLSWDMKVDEIEIIRSKFGYPADMSQCGRYGPSQEAISHGLASASDVTKDPLLAMSEVIAKLKQKFGIGA